MSSRRCTVFVGNLPPNVQKPDIEDVFTKYGPITRIDLKANGPDAPIAFVEYEDPRDCDDAIRGRDGYDMDGYRLRCEMTRGNGGGGLARNNDRGSGIRGSRPPGPPSRRTEFRIRITGLPKSGSWQDLKDHMRNAGDVCFSEVFGDGSGAVEYSNYEDMRTALKKLDDTKFKSHEGETSYISIEEDRSGAKTHGIPRAAAGNRYGYRDRSPGRGSSGGRRRSPSYSPPNRKGSRGSPSYRDRSRSRSRSPRRVSPSASPPRKSSNYS